MAERTKYILDEADMPTRWYNVIPDLPEPPPPPLHPGTREPVGTRSRRVSRKRCGAKKLARRR
ncbi:hypothetical protein [Amycolatopsis sp. cmx-11-12]|uniref:hypothetical protein n=1 Tax=Amycolatopsis sp. cmx-11-12 TaxID=2785795 RepID=UPI003917B714